MRKISAVFEPCADGTLHLPIPADWKEKPIRVTAELQPVETADDTRTELKGFGCLRGKITMAQDFDAPLADFKEYT